ncbi:protein ERGIC-53-like, partial [Saccostrea cucullata]|uniref:protein ERGIC-53-like n=1 Tax=Saccostrea cuccullata TaxID=36930 RepID=UPI002ED603B5
MTAFLKNIKSTMWSQVILVCSLINLAYGLQQEVSFEYKYSFKGPHLTLENKSIPFWDYGGDAITGDDYIILTSYRRSMRGWVWSTLKTSFNQWSVDCVFKVTGRGRVGSDGLAVWFTEDKGQEGPVFGNQNMWRGLGVFMDSFDNDGQRGLGVFMDSFDNDRQ